MTQTLRDLSNNFKKYNLGCGNMLYRDFLNIGHWHQLGENTIYQDVNGKEGTFMLNYDLRNGIPAHDGSLELVYHCHMLEHLSYQDGVAFIKECYRVLAAGGRMRIVVPDLELWAKAYATNNRFFMEEYRKVLDKDLYVTNGAIFMGMLHNHDHKCGYDFETLKWVLEHAGFGDVRKTLYADSEHVSNISEIEPYNAVRVMESLCVECVRP
jgi:predicted SAM-dependent methyltransferase